MKKPPHKGKKPDINELAKLITSDATDESKTECDDATDKSPKKSGRRGGLKGGKSRAEKLSPERRREIAETAARKRWEKP